MFAASAAPGELVPPQQYSGWWLVVALAILVAIAAGAWIVWALTRPARERPEEVEPPLSLDDLRARYLGLIDDVEAAYADGSMRARAANAELSRLTRAFVNEYTGLETPVMSLDELVARGVHPSLVDALRRHYYPSLFRRGVVVDPVAGAAAARRVVTAWH
ncbi:hypothetical protein [Microbacterium indicum]|uniref:hypothetical protein n=1 Tax=Microbacterium indicum TaxID=358100 RepID=UPI00055DAC3D|nr:hypothetical protein [Microbacterium indicum]